MFNIILCVLYTLILSSYIALCDADQIVPLHNPVLYDIKGEMKLTCNVTMDTKNVEINWQKDGKLVSEIPSLKNRITQKKEKSLHSLYIKRADEGDSGTYTCNAEINGVTHSIKLEAYGKVRVRTPSNINVVEGEKLKIVCDVIGTPTPSIYWIAINETYMESRDRVQILTDEDSNIPNTVFVIETIKMSDRGLYTCVANSTLSSHLIKDKTMVRVKDKYAALWPFLGICAEVFILCTIILVYEKKRNKSEMEESDTDQSPDQKNTPNHGKDSNLRHRQ